MSYVPLEKLIDKSHGSMYKLVVMVSRRALDLAEGAPKLMEASSDLKATTLAMQEIAAGYIGMSDKKDKNTA